MDLPDRRDTSIDILIALHTTKSRLAALINARRSRGEPTADLDALFATNRGKAAEMALFLRMNPGILDSFAQPRPQRISDSSDPVTAGSSR